MKLFETGLEHDHNTETAWGLVQVKQQLVRSILSGTNFGTCFSIPPHSKKDTAQSLHSGSKIVPHDPGSIYPDAECFHGTEHYRINPPQSHKCIQFAMQESRADSHRLRLFLDTLDAHCKDIAKSVLNVSHFGMIPAYAPSRRLWHMPAYASICLHVLAYAEKC